MTNTEHKNKHARKREARSLEMEYQRQVKLAACSDALDPDLQNILDSALNDIEGWAALPDYNE